MLMVLAGTPDSEMHLGQARTNFCERVERFRIGSIPEGAGFRALAEPLAEWGVGFDGEVIRKAVREAQGYPYFLQCWGAALWDAEARRQANIRYEVMNQRRSARRSTGQPHVGMEALSAAGEAALERCRRLHSERLGELGKYGMTALAAELVLDWRSGLGLRAASGKLIGHLARRWEIAGEVPRGLPNGREMLRHSAEQLLLHTGFVWAAGADEKEEWEFGIPSLARHVERVVPHRIAGELAAAGAGVALPPLLAVAGRRPLPRSGIVKHLADSVTAGDQGAAEEMLRTIEDVGLLGWLGVEDPLVSTT